MSEVSRWSCEHVPGRFGNGGVFLDLVDLTPGAAVQRAQAAARELVDNGDEAKALLLSGPVGCGKSHIAAAACNEVAARLFDASMAADAELDRVSAISDEWERVTLYPNAERRSKGAERRFRRECPRWVSVPGYLERLKREMHIAGPRPSSELAEDVLKTTGLLVLDDLGAEKATDWSLGVLFELVAARYDEGLQLIVTSNRTVRQLHSSGYERIISRLEDGGMLIEMASAKSYRSKLRHTVPA